MDALRAFMGELIDYAGLFPPAALDLPTSMQEYGRLRRQPEAWMLGRFIVPLGRLAELAGHLAEPAPPLPEPGAVAPEPEPPWRLAVIVDANAQRIAADAMRRSVEGAAGRLDIETIETRVPAAILAAENAGAVRQHISELEARLAEAGFAGRPVYCEAAGAEEQVLAALAGTANDRGGPAPSWHVGVPRHIGLKLRCGGPRAEDVPAAERVAAVISECAAAGVPLKLTAGLHHPLRRLVGTPGAWQHGFLNVVGAGVLAACGRLDRAGVLACLLEEDATGFRFDGSFAWRGHAAATSEIAAARRKLMVGFGSCSFSEPMDGLRALGLLG